VPLPNRLRKPIPRRAVETDKFIMVVATGAFLAGLWMGLDTVWVLGTTVLVVLMYIALRYPRGKADWKQGPVETVYTISTMVTMLLMVYVIYLAGTSLRLPGAMQITTAIAALAFMVMFLLGLFYPQRPQLPFIGKK